MKPNNHSFKKAPNELKYYRDMVKNPTEENNTEVNFSMKSLQGTNEIDNNDTLNDKHDIPVERAPLNIRITDKIEKYFIQILCSILGALCLWTIGLQIGQAVHGSEINKIKEDINEIKVLINEKYIRKDIYDIQIEDLKEKIKEIQFDLKILTDKIKD